MASFKSRLLAYIIDMLIITIILTFINVIFKPSDNYIKLNKELNQLEKDFDDEKIQFDTYYYKRADITQQIDKEKIYINLIQGFLLVGYFIILPYYYNGQTLGKKAMKIKIVSENGELEYNQLIIRTLIVDGLGYLIIIMSILYIVPSFYYYLISNLLSLTELFILIISSKKIIKSDSHKGIQDLLSKTTVINE